LDKGKTIVLSEKPALVMERSSKIKKILPDLSTKIKTQISEKKRKKQRYDSDAGEIAGNFPKVIIEIPQEQVGEIAENIPEVIVEVPKEKVGEIENTPELRVKRKEI
jgi:hypothetical protein